VARRKRLQRPEDRREDERRQHRQNKHAGDLEECSEQQQEYADGGEARDAAPGVVGTQQCSWICRPS
jgi:hypothetical protein